MAQQAKKNFLCEPGHLSSLCEPDHLSLIPGNYGARRETLSFNPHTHLPAFTHIHHTYSVTNKMNTLPAVKIILYLANSREKITRASTGWLAKIKHKINLKKIKRKSN